MINPCMYCHDDECNCKIINNKFTINDVHINAGNFLNRQICIPSDMNVSTATKLLNDKDECGTTMGWVFTPEQGVVACDDRPEHKHLCFHC